MNEKTPVEIVGEFLGHMFNFGYHSEKVDWAAKMTLGEAQAAREAFEEVAAQLVSLKANVEYKRESLDRHSDKVKLLREQLTKTQADTRRLDWLILEGRIVNSREEADSAMKDSE